MLNSWNNFKNIEQLEEDKEKIMTRITEAAKVEKIVDYSFERNEKANVLAIHPTLPLIAYLINIQRTPKISKAWTSESPSSSTINGQINNQNQANSSSNTDKQKTVSVRIIDYQTRQRCLAKGVYHARPTECVFTINSIICSQAEVIKLAVVDRLANIYLYDLSYFINELTATRIAVIRSPGEINSPYDMINLVWCPFVPCEDFDDGDGGLRLALSTNSRIEIFAIDRLQGKTGELQRNDLKGAYKCINDAHKTNIVSLSISPDCSTISAAALDNRVTFFSSDIDDGGQRCLHNWVANVPDKSSIAKLFFLDDYPRLLEDSTMKFWGSAFIGTRSGQTLLVDLRTWSVYQKEDISPDTSGPKNFDYRIDLTSQNIIAINGNQCFVVQISIHDGGLPRILKSTALILHNPIYSFVIKHKSVNEIELFTISAYSLERYIIDLVAISQVENVSVPEGRVEDEPVSKRRVEDIPLLASLVEASQRQQQLQAQQLRQQQQHLLQQQQQKQQNIVTANIIAPQNELNRFPMLLKQAAAAQLPQQYQQLQQIQQQPHHQQILLNNNIEHSQPSLIKSPMKVENNAVGTAGALDVGQMDRMVEALFTKLNTAFSQGLDEFLSDIKCEVNDLKLKLNGLCRDVRKLQQQLQEARQK